MKIRNRTGQLAQERHLSTAELAEKAGITYNTALSLVRGNAARIDLQVLEKVCEALGVQPGDILVLETDDTSQNRAPRRTTRSE